MLFVVIFTSTILIIIIYSHFRILIYLYYSYTASADFSALITDILNTASSDFSPVASYWNKHSHIGGILHPRTRGGDGFEYLYCRFRAGGGGGAKNGVFFQIFKVTAHPLLISCFVFFFLQRQDVTCLRL